MKARPDDWVPVVWANRRRVKGYILSGSHPACLQMAKDEVASINRVMQWVPLDAVADLEPAEHWFMAVVLCPRDDLGVLVDWAKDKDTDRIHFYLHRDADTTIFAAWRDADLPLNRIELERFTTYGKMHARLGFDLSDRVYADFAP